MNPVFRLTTAACSRNTYRPVVKSDPGWNRTSTFLDVGQASSPLDHGIVFSVTRVGVEPTKSPRPQRDRFTGLRTWSFRKWRVRGSHPAVQAYEARMSTGPPASSCRSRYRAGQTGLMKASWTPAAPAMLKVAKGRLALPRPFGHDVLNVARLLIPPLGYVSDPYGNRTHAARVRVSHPAARPTGRVVSASGRS